MASLVTLLAGGALMAGGSGPVAAQDAALSGEPTATDVDASTVMSGPGWLPLAGGGAALWGGGSLVFPADTSGEEDNQTYRSVAASLQAEEPACHDGTVEVTASTLVTNDGPNDGFGYSGGFRLFHADDIPADWFTRTTLDEVHLVDTPADAVELLTVSAQVAAEDLLAGDIFVQLDLETYHSGDGTTLNTGTDWTAEEFAASYEFGEAVCESEVVKSSDVTEAQAGDVVTYTVEVTNVGTAPFEESITDDLSGVLDDATYNGDVAASTGDVSVSGDMLDWSGTLEVDETATITYSVTIDDPPMGDGVLDNVIVGGPCPDPAITDPDDPDYDPDCHNTVVLLPELETDKTVDATEAAPGDTVTYTVALTNVGEGDFTDENPASFLDDLSGVLDDATYNDDASASDGSTVSFDDPELSWAGPLAAGETVTVTYSVTVDDPAEGDSSLDNLVVTPNGNCIEGSDDTGCATSTPVAEPDDTTPDDAAAGGEPAPGEAPPSPVTAGHIPVTH